MRWRPALVAMICVSVLGPWSAGRVAALEDPLTLESALAHAQSHPRVTASTTFTERLPRRQPLYLDCHGLAFEGEDRALDPDRNRPLLSLIEASDAQRLEIMTRFFDVMLADQSFATESEAMAVAYIQYDRAAVRGELGQVSPLRVLELEAIYQQILHRRTASEISQQLTRALLAQALGDPSDLPRNLLAHSVPPLPNPLPSLDAMLERALAAPKIGDRLAGLAESERDLLQMELRQQVLELSLRLRALDSAERNLRTESAWRDLKLDESRTLYEQEVTADLGYSMSQQTQTRMQGQRVAYCRVLAWAELNALMGRALLDGEVVGQ
ncbi:MAG: hypothetical protein EOM91_05440 [Sphingobacteriia bacterium]|nr:hypothetical protein [Sphingobacteriia bacterium]NCC38575.1 hypothetical protein [Gammaproteobacteria bacterium]